MCSGYFHLKEFIYIIITLLLLWIWVSSCPKGFGCKIIVLIHSSVFSGQIELDSCWEIYLVTLCVLLCMARAAVSFGWKLVASCLLSYLVFLIPLLNILALTILERLMLLLTGHANQGCSWVSLHSNCIIIRSSFPASFCVPFIAFLISLN